MDLLFQFWDFSFSVSWSLMQLLEIITCLSRYTPVQRYTCPALLSQLISSSYIIAETELPITRENFNTQLLLLEYRALVAPLLLLFVASIALF